MAPIAVVVVAAGGTTACNTPASAPVPSPASTTASSSVASATTPPPSPTIEPPASPGPEPRTIKWVELAVGDCTTGVPAVELGEVTVTVTDCSGPHAAEVYLLAPIAVNTALADVANRVCADGLSGYVGQSEQNYSITNLIDSRQDRTSNNPLPSTVICLLQAATGAPLTGSARG